MIRDAIEKQTKIEALTEQYRRGEISEPVYRASLHIQGLRNDDLRMTINEHQLTHRQSLPYKRGLIAS